MRNKQHSAGIILKSHHIICIVLMTILVSCLNRTNSDAGCKEWLDAPAGFNCTQGLEANNYLSESIKENLFAQPNSLIVFTGMSAYGTSCLGWRELTKPERSSKLAQYNMYSLLIDDKRKINNARLSEINTGLLKELTGNDVVPMYVLIKNGELKVFGLNDMEHLILSL